MSEARGGGPSVCGAVRKTMHDFLIALAYVGMIVAPAVFAASANSGAPPKSK